MHTVQFPYGDGFIELPLPEEATVLMPEFMPGVADELTAVRQAMQRPVASDRLVNLAKGKNSVAIVINDITRPSPTEIMLTAILEELAAAGIDRQSVTVLVATGNHEAPTEAELRKMMGRWYSQLRIVAHDCAAPDMLAYVGATARTTPVYVNKRYAAAELRILTGVITPHQSAGFGGGRKSVVPGIAGLETIKRIHSFPIRPDRPVLGLLKGNRFHEEVVAAARLAGVDFIVNVVKNYRGEVVGVTAGDLEAAHQRGVRLCEQSWVRKIDTAYDVVVVSPGRQPKDVDLHQAQKGLVVAEQAVKPGGTIVLVARCVNGIGKFGKILKAADSIDAVIKDFYATGSSEDNKGKAYLFARCCQKCKVFVVSDIAPDEIAEMFMTGFSSLAQAVDSALAQYSRPSILCIPYAGDCIPIIENHDTTGE